MKYNDEIRLVLSKRKIKALLFLALVAGGAYALRSESFTMSTAYPAPSGIYRRMITTGDTFLAREGVNVGIGTTNPRSKLSVAGVIESTAQGLTFPDGTTQATAAAARAVTLNCPPAWGCSCSGSDCTIAPPAYVAGACPSGWTCSVNPQTGVVTVAAPAP